MQLYNLPFVLVSNFVWSQYKNGYKLSEYQRRFMTGEKVTDKDLFNSHPIIKTPTDHDCYKQLAANSEVEVTNNSLIESIDESR